jgi:GNAT superfamily N-acetyltransferase
MSALRIRPVTPSDRDVLETMIEACYAASYPGWYDAELLRAALPLMRRTDDKLLASGRYFIAFLGEDLAGCGGWSMWTPGTKEEQPGIAHIRHFATHPSFMRRGVAGAILRRCFEESAATGVRLLQCYSSRAAETFYAHHGFQRVREININLSPTVAIPAILMEKMLLQA